MPIASQKLYHNGLELVNDKTLEQCDLPPGDAFLGLQVRNPQPSSSWSTRPPTGAHGTGREPAGPSRRPQPGRGAPDAEMLRLQALGSPAALAQIRSQAPALADSIHDPARFGQMFQQMVQQQQDAEAGKDRNIALLNADPFNVEAQKQIEDYIRQDQVMKNMETAMEYHPEGDPLTFSHTSRHCKRAFKLTIVQPLVEYICCTSQLKSTTLGSKPLSTPAPRLQ